MKKIFQLAKPGLILGSMFLLFSCDLEEYNPSGVTAEAIWSTPEGFETLVAGVYSIQRDFYGKENALFMNEAGTDLWFNAGYSNYANEYMRYEGLTAIGGNYHGDTWKKLYRGANLANIGIAQVEEIEWPGEEEKNAKKAEMHFMRAWYYWHIVESFGNVTLHTEPIQGVVLTAERSPEEDFYDMIIADLQFAAEHLPYSQGEQYSRASKKSALGLLARAALSGAYQDQARSNEYFTLARDAAKELIDNQEEYGVALWDTPAEIYDPDNNKENKEACWVASNSFNDELNIRYGARAFWYFSIAYYDFPGLERSVEYGRGSSRFMPTRALLDFYDEEMDARYNAFFREVWLCNNDSTIPYWSAQEVINNGLDFGLIGSKKFEVGDTALLCTKKSIADEGKFPYKVYDRDSIYYASGYIKPSSSQYFPTLIKFDDPFRDDPENRYGHLDVIFIRLAEVYFVAAEAELQLGNPSVAADYLNVLRTRAAVPGHEAEMQITSDDVTIDFILDERARELCGEWIRWYDLKRTGKLVERVNQYNPDITAIQDFHVVRPIHQSELDALLNAEEYGQNDGY